MHTHCSTKTAEFQPLGARKVVARFDGGAISSDGGALLLRECEAATKIIAQFARCFVDRRDPALIEHTVEQLVAQRTYGLALGYEDLNDHDTLRHDPLLATLVGKHDPTGQSRKCEADRGKALAGKSTLNRLELTAPRVAHGERYKKIALDAARVERLFVELFVQAHEAPPDEIVLDLDATDDPLHGRQEGRFFHGYYDAYCYLPLYIFCGDHLLAATLRPSNIDASAGALDALERLVAQIRVHWPRVKIVVRADSGFCREPIMRWCESCGVDYVLGLARNARLVGMVADALAQAKALHDETGEAARVFAQFAYSTLKSWSRPRRVIAKAEHLERGANPRFIVTTLDENARALYEDLYCARGDMENRIKEQQLALFADRTSAATLRANQLRLWFSSVAYTLMAALRRLALAGTELAHAQCDTIRCRLLKIGARITVSVRRVWVSLSQSCPATELFWRVWHNLRRLVAPRCVRQHC
jgi:hypothetical protein